MEPLLDDLCAFINRDDLPAVVQAGLVHAQFETVHPFADGNGRTGRALIHVVLSRRSAVTQYVPPVSLALATDSRAYIAGLNAFRYDRQGGQLLPAKPRAGGSRCSSRRQGELWPMRPGSGTT